MMIQTFIFNDRCCAFRMSKAWLVCALLAVTTLAAAPGLVQAQDAAAPTSAEKSVAVEEAKPLAVTVFPFSTPKGQEKMGQDVGEMLTLLLSAEPGLQLIERETLNKVIEEQTLSLTGLVDASQAIRVGKLVGAQIIVVGRIFELGESRLVTAKLISSETTQILGAVERGSLEKPVDELVFALGVKVATILQESGAKLTATREPIDPLAAVREQLKQWTADGGTLPVVAVVVREKQHVAAADTSQVDPAVETQIKHELLKAGVTVKDVGVNALAYMLRNTEALPRNAWPASLEGVDLVIMGEAFSEGGPNVGELRIAVARAEINLIVRGEGKVGLSEAVTARGVDLSPLAAGKNALSRAGSALSVPILKYILQQAENKKTVDAKPAGE